MTRFPMPGAALLLLSCLGLGAWADAPPGEAYYKGKPRGFWSERLRAEAPEARREAVQALAAMGPEAAPAVPLLLKALDDDDTAVRVGALEALSRVGPGAKAGVPAFLRAAGDKDGQYRMLAVRALGGVGPSDPAVVPALVKAFLEEPYQAGEELRRMGPAVAKQAVPALADALKTRPAAVRGPVVQLLGAMGPDAAPALSRAVRDEDPGVRQAAVAAFARLGTEAEMAVANLRPALHVTDPQVRAAAAKALVPLGPAAVPALAEALGDSDPLVRRPAAEGLAAAGTKARDFVPALVKALGDADPYVGGKAAEALAQAGPAAVDPLMDALRSGKTFETRNGYEGLRRMGAGARSAAPALVLALKASDVPYRDAAAGLLQNMGPDAGPALLEGMRDKDNARAHLVLGGVSYGTRRPPVPDLLTLLKDTDPVLRARAAHVLAALGPAAREAAPALRDALADPEPDVRRSAERALRAMDGRR